MKKIQIFIEDKNVQYNQTATITIFCAVTEKGLILNDY